jgi:hypothetical protein
VLCGGSATSAASGPAHIVRVSTRKMKDLFAGSVTEQTCLRPIGPTSASRGVVFT